MRIAVAFARAVTRPKGGLCRACVEVLAVSGAGITVMGEGDQAGPLCVSSHRVATLEDLQFTMGIGPCQDAYATGLPVHAPRFDSDTVARWPSFVDQARDSGIGGVFAYPLFSNGARVGVLTLYQDDEGELSSGQHDDSMAVADVLTETVLSLQDGAPAGVLADGLQGAVAYRAQIYQASGMVAIQLRIPVSEALLRIRAHAFSNNETIGAVAADIVARRLRLNDDRDVRGEGV